MTGDHWIFNCDSADQRDEWVECIERMIKNSLSIGSLAESIESRSITSTGSQPNFDRPGNKSCAGKVTPTNHAFGRHSNLILEMFSNFKTRLSHAKSRMGFT